MNMTDFCSELNSFEIHLPGSNTIQFNNDEVLQHFMDQQYPHWTEPGHVTSIPIGRLPRLFLNADQMAESLEKRFKSLQKGESGEIKIYQLIMEASKKLNDGVCVLPNIDGNDFESKMAHVEIDMVVIHPKKGVFVFNIKNAAHIKEKILVEDMRKHTNFIRLLRDFNMHEEQGGSCAKFPIHGVICSLQKDVDESRLAGFGYLDIFQADESRLLFQPSDIESFSTKWLSELSAIPDIKDCMALKRIGVLATRLAALNSREGSLALLHNRFISDDIQKFYVKEKESLQIVKEQFKSVEQENSVDDDGLINAQLVEQMNDLQLKRECRDTKRKKRSVILWTKEQLKVIHSIGTMLLDRKGGVVGVTGPRGCGKTMLLVYLAHLAKHIFQSNGNDYDGSVVIADGRMGASVLLFEKLKADFKNTGINVNVNVNTYIKVLTSSFISQLNGKFVLLDECNIPDIWKNIGPIKCAKHQLVILFTSKPNILDGVSASYETFSLSNSLRATKGLTRFVDDFRLSDPLCSEYPTVASHNFDGSGPDLRCVSINIKEDPYHLSFVHEAVSAIMENLEKSKGLKEVLVTPYVHPITLERVVSELQLKGVGYRYRNPRDMFSKSQTWEEDENDGFENTTSMSGSRNCDSSSKSANNKFSFLPQLTFVTGNHVDGAEYAAVVILLERSLPHWWDEFIFDSIYIAITRATTNLAIIFDDTDEAPLILHNDVSDNVEATPLSWRKVFKPSDVNISAYSLLSSPIENNPRHLRRIIAESYWSKHPVWVIGKCPPGLPEFSEIDPPSLYFQKKMKVKKENQGCRKQVIWFEGPHNKRLANLIDVEYLWENLVTDINDDMKMTGISAIVFIVHSMTEFSKLCQHISRHFLLYFMFEYQIASCPLYLISPFSVSPSRLNTPSICDFISSRAAALDASNLSPDFEVETSPRVQSWIELKNEGAYLFKDGRLDSSLSMYMKSMEILKLQYNDSIQTSDVKCMIENRDEISKLYSNISKVNFDIALSFGEEFDRVKMKSSLEFAVKSVEMNPTWNKGYHRMAEAMQKLGDEEAAAKTREEGVAIGELMIKKQYEMKRDAVLKLKMVTCPSWGLVKYKDNAFIIDKEGEGHFSTIYTALMEKGKKLISLIINPGIYKCPVPIAIDDFADVDIVGNWDASIYEDKWVLREPPVVIQDIEDIGISIFKFNYNIFVVENSRLSLSRVSIYNWQPSLALAVLIKASSNVSLYQCAFKSQCGAAIVAVNGVDLNIDGCRSVNTYAGVLADGDCSVNISNSFFHKVKMIGLEFRENVSANVKSCTISHCENAGIFCTRGEINILSCFLEGNSYKKSINEGSIQLRSSRVFVSKTQIQNQIGNGIVIEFGSGEFKDVVIERCKNSGFLIQAPCTISHCKISNCRNGITLCNNINGHVYLEGNTISCCSLAVHRFPNAPKPIINGETVSLSSASGRYTDRMTTSTYNVMRGKDYFEKQQKNRKILEELASVMGPLGEVLGATSVDGVPHCSYCTLPLTSLERKPFLCESCELAFYCSIECCTKDKEIHHSTCEKTQTELEAFRKSKYFKDESPMKTESKERDTSRTTSSNKTRGSSSNKSNASKKQKKLGQKKKKKKSW